MRNFTLSEIKRNLKFRLGGQEVLEISLRDQGDAKFQVLSKNFLQFQYTERGVHEMPKLQQRSSRGRRSLESAQCRA
jgi:hypothetical protein